MPIRAKINVNKRKINAHETMLKIHISVESIIRWANSPLFFKEGMLNQTNV